MEAAITAGWDSITQAFQGLYPSQTEPVHYAPMISYRMGGNDPLDGISIYDGGSFYHFVTYGFSELYEKESNQPEYSGFGFELTMKVAKEGIRKREREQKNICGILQTIARMSFENGDIFMPGEYIYTGQSSGIDADGTSQITGFITMEDPLGTIKTPNGTSTVCTACGGNRCRIENADREGTDSISDFGADSGGNYRLSAGFSQGKRRTKFLKGKKAAQIWAAFLCANQRRK